MPRRTPPRGPLPPPTDADTTRAFGVLLEDVRSNMRIVAAALVAVTAATEKNTAQLGRVEVRLGRLEDVVVTHGDRIGRLESVVMAHGERIGGLESVVLANGDRTGRLEDAALSLTHEVRELRGDVASLRHAFEHRAERRPA